MVKVKKNFMDTMKKFIIILLITPFAACFGMTKDKKVIDSKDIIKGTVNFTDYNLMYKAYESSCFEDIQPTIDLLGISVGNNEPWGSLSMHLDNGDSVKYTKYPISFMNQFKHGKNWLRTLPNGQTVDIKAGNSGVFDKILANALEAFNISPNIPINQNEQQELQKYNIINGFQHDLNRYPNPPTFIYHPKVLSTIPIIKKSKFFWLQNMDKRTAAIVGIGSLTAVCVGAYFMVKKFWR